MRGCGFRIGILFARSARLFRSLARSLDAWSIHVPMAGVSRRLVSRAHADGRQVFVFTVNEPADMRRMNELGVDGIFSDFPDRWTARWIQVWKSGCLRLSLAPVMELSPSLQGIAQPRWPAQRAWEWRSAQPWRVGCNFLPSTATNQLEMWQPDTFDPATIDRELGWLAALGMNSMRVFLHDLLWTTDSTGFLDRMDQYLSIAAGHGISTLFVFFDSCWHPFPSAGKQRDPEPGVHNAGWVQSPGVRILRDPAAFARLEAYVTGVAGRFRNDLRVEGWDIWNEPDNFNGNTYGVRDIFEAKAEVVLPLIAQAFRWVRTGRPVQPVTSGVWHWQDQSWDDRSPLHQFQVEASDIISFHCYAPPGSTQQAVEALKRHNRPIVCTEYMARPLGSTFQAILPLFKNEGVAAYNWGSISGRSQTIYPWDSWQTPYPPEPPLWFHDVLRADGTPYIKAETDLIRSLTH